MVNSVNLRTLVYALMFFIANMVQAQNTKPLINIDIIKEKLPNGLTLIMSPDHRVPTVAVEVRYLVGSAHEPQGRSGFAHLFEHLMFQGSKNYDQEYFTPFTPIGGKVNGTTNTDRTNYYEQVPAEALELALWMESDRMEGLLATLTQEKLDNQRDVVKNERRQRYENTPYGMVWKLFANELYPVGHPYQHTTIGSHEDLSAATLEDVKGFFEQYYCPSNAVITLVGDFDPKEAKELVYKYFSYLPAGKRAEKPLVTNLPKMKAKTITYPDRVKLPRVYLAWHTPALYEAGDAEMDLLATLLTSGKSSALYQPLVFEKQIAKEVFAFQVSRALGGYFVIAATAVPGQDIDQLTEELKKEVNKALIQPISKPAFTRALNAWRKSFFSRIESVLDRAQQISTYEHLLSNPNSFNFDLERYTSLTTGKVEKASKNWLLDHSPLTIKVVPEEQHLKNESNNNNPTKISKTKAKKVPQVQTSKVDQTQPTKLGKAKSKKISQVQPTNIDRSSTPKLAKTKSWEPPQVQTFKLANGLDVWLVEQQQSPLISMQLILNQGASTDPEDKAGLTWLTAHLLNEGAGNKNAIEVSDALRLLATDYGTNVYQDSISLSMDLLSENLSQSLDLLGDFIQRPQFMTADFERVKKQRIASAIASSASPNKARNITMIRTLFADGYAGLPSDGLPETLAKVTLDDVKKAYGQLIKPMGATLIVVGQTNQEQLKKELERVFAKWIGQGTSKPRKSKQPSFKGAIHWIDFPGSTQSAVAMVKRVDGYGVDPKLDAELFNLVFGGKFTSRLNLNLREDKGYTYGAYSGIYRYQQGGMHYLGAMVKGDQTAASITEMIKEIDHIRETKPITTKELERVRSGELKGYPAEFEERSGVLGHLSLARRENRSVTWLKEWMQALPNVTLQQTQAVAQKLAHSKDYSIIIAGDREKHFESIKSFGRPIYFHSANGNLITENSATK